MASEAFTKEIGATIAKGFVTSGLAMGTTLGLFKGLADLAQSKETSVTTQQLADSLNYKERYVREWINGMVCGDVVDHEEIDGVDRYWLESHRLPALLGDQMRWPAVYSEMLIAGMLKLPLVEKCFPADGPLGTQVTDYPEFHEFLAKREIKWNVPENCKLIMDDVTLQHKLEKGINVLEIGCGAAAPTKALATCFSKSTFVATDISPSVLEGAQSNCKDLANVSCQLLDACNIPENMAGQFDLVMLFDVYHDVPKPQVLVDSVLRLLKQGGQLLMNDVDAHEKVSHNKVARGSLASSHYIISTLYCLPTCVNTPEAEGLGACGGKELYERRLKKDFSTVVRVGEDFGLYFLCTK